MKLVLILMVRNESRILERCLESVKDVVDAFCIHDTGSTDNTCDIARAFLEKDGNKGCLTTSVWKDFGCNRTASFVAARDYLESSGWDLETTYGLLLDADMVFHPGTLRSLHITRPGYSIVQIAGELEYPNCRLVRMDHPWKCIGVTHEYWDGAAEPLPKSVCWIEDRNDGGCKADKFERDARLLEAGLAENPKNERYMFYLAQTYHSLGRWKDCIAMYKKRFEAGGWDEERWYSLYMIGDAYLKLDEPLKFELYMQRAMRHRPSRAEASYALTKYFREKGQHYKAWYYLLQGRSLPFPTDSLFLVRPVYSDLFHYEETILLYYLDRLDEGLHKSIVYLLTKKENLDTVYRNMVFYVKPLGTPIQNHPVPRDAAGSDFHPTSVSFLPDGTQNVRFVNYIIDQRNGSYTMKDGTYSPDHKVRTRNVYWDGTKARLMDESDVGLSARPARIEGLEDVRVYSNHEGDLQFVATSSQYSDKVRIVRGNYDCENGKMTNLQLLHPPEPTECEKNWLPIPDTDSFVYKWSPLEIGRVGEDGTLNIIKRHATPWFFRHLRGSAVPVRVGSEWWVLTHYVEYGQPRKYFHCIVVVDLDFKPRRLSLPFVFKSKVIEYCLGMCVNGENVEFVFSSWDDDPCTTSAPMSHFSWIQV